jgi:hypothetical protein
VRKSQATSLNNKMKDKESKYRLDTLEILIITISVILLVFAFFAPALFVNNSINGFDFTKSGQIGDTVGGIMNPFITLAGVFLTFLAFYIQFKANKQQKELFRQELDSNKFESQFYEMLRLHKENVNEINLKLTSDTIADKELVIQNEEVVGRECFKYYLEELKIIYYVVKKNLPNDDENKLINIAYSIFFIGSKFIKGKQREVPEDKAIINSIEGLSFINNGNQNTGTRGNKNNFKAYVSKKSDYSGAQILNYDLFQGHSANLAHYYRHLYQTVKFIVKQDENFLNYEQKRNYLRILRSQLSNQEQAMLFYNWKSDFGSNWENSINKYFTDYRMIHNLYNDLLISDFDLKIIFDIKNLEYKKENNRQDDSLFEFQDW